jgi:Family of unknown function (DUF6318)
MSPGRSGSVAHDPRVKIVRVTKRLTALALTLASCLVMSACSGSSPDTSATSASPGTSPSGNTTSPSPAPSIPAYATGADLHGQEGFARFWVDTVNKATDTGNTTAMKSLATRSCTTCAGFAHTLDKIYGAGGQVVSKGWKIQSLVPIANQPASQPGLELGIQLSPQTVTRRKGAKPKAYTGGVQNFRFFMIREGSYWLVQRLEI